MTNSDKQELKACPFCGGRTLTQIMGRRYPCYDYRIEHKKDCYLYDKRKVNQYVPDDKQEAWNRRATK